MRRQEVVIAAEATRCAHAARRAVLALLLLGGTTAGAADFPDVVAVAVHPRAADVFDFDVTVSSPYDTPARYADAFRVVATEGGRVFGERRLLHDHANEQPFTRDLYGVRIPAGIRTVRVEARDRQNGYGGKAQVVPLPGR